MNGAEVVADDENELSCSPGCCLRGGVTVPDCGLLALI